MPPAWMFSQQVNEDVVDDVTSVVNSDHDGEAVPASETGGADTEQPYPTNTTNGTEVVRRGSEFESVPSEMIPKNGFYVSKPYKREIIAQQVTENSPGANRRMAIIGALRDLGVKVFIIEAKSIQTTADILHHVRRVIGFVARENRHVRHQEPLRDDDYMSEVAGNSLGFQRCLLYQDKTGRLFNLILSPHAVGPASKFEDYLDSFNGLQALVVLTVMCRSFSCMMTESAIDNLKPAILALILGLVLNEEIALSWLNANMLVRASPSVAAYTLTTMIGSDILRKGVILCLALAGATSGDAQKGLTIIGICGACLLLLSNLGSRAWHFMGWRPLPYQGTGAATVAWIVSIGTGMIFPFLANRKIHVGGDAALEYVIMTALIVGVIFIASGIDELQRFFLITSDACDQDFVNFAVGGWWFITFVASLFMAFKMPYQDQSSASASDGEPLLLKDHASPVGFKVPSVPDFEMDPSLAWTGALYCLRPFVKLVAGLILAVVLGGAIVFLGVREWDDNVVGEIKSETSSILN
ncbi:hypothetical protein ACA910_008544 [Epithemia clementina (nom. ined.)]